MKAQRNSNNRKTWKAAVLLALAVCFSVSVSGVSSANPPEEGEYYLFDLTKGYEMQNVEFAFADYMIFGESAELKGGKLDIDSDGTDDVMFECYCPYDCKVSWKNYVIPLHGGSIRGAVTFPVRWKFDMLDVSLAYDYIVFVFENEPVAESYSITVKGGQALDRDGNPVTSAAPGTYIKIVGDEMTGSYVKAWKAEGFPSFAKDFNPEGGPYIEINMPAADLVLEPVIEKQKPLKLAHMETLSASLEQALKKTVGVELVGDYYEYADLDGDGSYDFYITPSGDSSAIIYPNYVSFCGLYELTGENKTPYSPLILDFSGKEYPFEVDLSRGYAYAWNYSWDMDENVFEWMRGCYGTEADPNVLDLDGDGSADILIGHSEDRYIEDIPVWMKCKMLYILDSYSLGDVYTLPEIDNPEYRPYTFTLKGKGINPCPKEKPEEVIPDENDPVEPEVTPVDPDGGKQENNTPEPTAAVTAVPSPTAEDPVKEPTQGASEEPVKGEADKEKKSVIPIVLIILSAVVAVSAAAGFALYLRSRNRIVETEPEERDSAHGKQQERRKNEEK